MSRQSGYIPGEDITLKIFSAVSGMQSLSMTEYGNTFRELSMSGGWPITDSLMSKTVTVKTDPCSGKHDLGNGEMNLNVGHECAS